MTENEPERILSSEEELFVTKALRDLPAPPVPPALAARLDARLAELQDERARSAPAEVATLSGRSGPAPSRRWPRLVLAAAAVLVGGYAVGAAVDGSLTGSSGSSDSTAEGTAGGAADAGKSAPEGATHRSAQEETIPLEAATLHPGTFGADVRRLLRTVAPPRDHTGVWSPAGVRAPVGCPAPRGGPGSTVWLVRYDGVGAFLVTRPAGDTRVHAQLFTCHTGPPSGTATPPSPSPVPSSVVTVRVTGAP